MAHIIDLLSLLVNVSGLLVGVFGLTGDFKRRVAIVILHLVGAYVSAQLILTGAYILAQCFLHLFPFLAEWFFTFLSAQFIATASPDLSNLLKFLLFLLSLIAVILSLHLLYTSIRDFLFTKVEAQMVKKFIEYISSELSIKDATDKALSDIVKDLLPSLKYAFIRMSYFLLPVFLYYISLGALLLGVYNFFNATFLCPNDAVWQVGAIFLTIHIVHTWLSVTSNGKYSLYSSFQLYVLRGFIRGIIRQLLSKVYQRKQENQRNGYLPRLSAFEFFIVSFIASLMPPLPIQEPKTFSAILLPLPKGVNCSGTTKDQRDQICKMGVWPETRKWLKDEVFQSLLSALKEVTGNTGYLVTCDSTQIFEIIRKLEGKKGINKILQECKADSEFYGPLTFRYYLFQCMFEAVYKAFEKGRVSPHDLLIVAELQLVNGIPVRYEVTKKGREVEIKECYCKLKADQVNETYYPIYLIAAWGDSAEEISQISLCLRLPTHG
ncbi:MAG: hypothetical protein ACO2PM_20535 [Pyrobaculum sp.]|jgi:hypothetical protein